MLWADTAAPYVRAIASRLDPTGALFGGRVLSGGACTAREGARHGRVKCLERLGRDLRRVVLVDDNRQNALPQPCNCLPVAGFFAEPKELREDTALSGVLDLLGELSKLADVRPALRRRFGVAAALERSPVGRHLWLTHDGSADYTGRWEPAAESAPSEEVVAVEEETEPPPPSRPPSPRKLKPIVHISLSEKCASTRAHIEGLSKVKVKKLRNGDAFAANGEPKGYRVGYWARKKKKGKKKKKKEKKKEKQVEREHAGGSPRDVSFRSGEACSPTTIKISGPIQPRPLPVLTNKLDDNSGASAAISPEKKAAGAQPSPPFSFLAAPVVKISWLTQNYHTFLEKQQRRKGTGKPSETLPPVSARSW